MDDYKRWNNAARFIVDITPVSHYDYLVRSEIELGAHPPAMRGIKFARTDHTDIKSAPKPPVL
jgi:hypothetical protein